MALINVQSSEFPLIRKNQAIYVDKTADFYRLVQGNQSCASLFFLARPRRFGKSLMLSTFKAIFEGKRELFDGLAIAKTDYDWQPYPVIHLDMSQTVGEDVDSFLRGLRTEVSLAIRGERCDSAGESPRELFAALLKKLSLEGRQAVVLIDEYDAPICHTLNRPELCERIRGELANFYSVLKGNQAAIRFAMITGISKFASLSIFSGLNNLIDLTTDPDYATMLGYTEQELTDNFGEHIARRAAEMGLSLDDFRAGLAKWFNGYRFAINAPTTVYNPVAIARTLTSYFPYFEGQWTATGRPSMLVNFVRREELQALDFEKPLYVSRALLEAATNLVALDPIAVLYQAGYLTLDSYDPARDRYKLRIPDEEVRRDLMNFVFEMTVDSSTARNNAWCHTTLDDLEAFLYRDLPALYAQCHYGSTERFVQEANYQRILQVLFLAKGYHPIAEAGQSSGKRADLVVTVPDLTYIFEFKRDGSTAEEALAQIKEKNYAAPYLHDGRPIALVGLAFDNTKRELIGIAHELLNDSSTVRNESANRQHP